MKHNLKDFRTSYHLKNIDMKVHVTKIVNLIIEVNFLFSWTGFMVSKS